MEVQQHSTENIPAYHRKYFHEPQKVILRIVKSIFMSRKEYFTNHNWIAIQCQVALHRVTYYGS